METAAEHRVRVKAPLEVVWSESSEPHRVARHAPEITAYHVDPSGDGNVERPSGVGPLRMEPRRRRQGGS